jgi:hypothetical protein
MHPKTNIISQVGLRPKKYAHALAQSLGMCHIKIGCIFLHWCLGFLYIVREVVRNYFYIVEHNVMLKNLIHNWYPYRSYVLRVWHSMHAARKHHYIPHLLLKALNQV